MSEDKAQEGKPKNWFLRHKIVTGVLVFFVGWMIVSGVREDLSKQKGQPVMQVQPAVSGQSLVPSPAQPAPAPRTVTQPQNVPVNEVSQPSPAENKETIAYSLAKIHAYQQRQSGVPSQEDIIFFEGILDRLMTKCQEQDKTRFGDYIVKTQELIKKERGIEMPLTEIATGVSESFPDNTNTKFDCGDMFALFVGMVVSC